MFLTPQEREIAGRALDTQTRVAASHLAHADRTQSRTFIELHEELSLIVRLLQDALGGPIPTPVSRSTDIAVPVPVPDAPCPSCGLHEVHVRAQHSIVFCEACGWRHKLNEGEAGELIFAISGGGDTPLPEFIRALCGQPEVAAWR